VRGLPVPPQVDPDGMAVGHQARGHLRPSGSVVAATVHEQHAGPLPAEVHTGQRAVLNRQFDVCSDHGDTLAAGGTLRN
jgi:hypothetical protein